MHADKAICTSIYVGIRVENLVTKICERTNEYADSLNTYLCLYLADSKNYMLQYE